MLDLIFFLTIHHGIQYGFGEVTISTLTGFDHGQILIETATHSLKSHSICIGTKVTSLVGLKYKTR